MDYLEKGIDPKTRISVATTDVTLTAKALEARHLSGPAAARILCDALVAVSLAAKDAGQVDEAFLFRIDSDGPIGGVLVEATGAGDLRGYTRQKILEDYDSSEPYDPEPLVGHNGDFSLQVSLPGKLMSQARFRVPTPTPRFCLARYFNYSQQTPTGVAIVVDVNSGGIFSARGAIVQRMPDGNPEAFVSILETMQGNTLEEAVRKDAHVEALRGVLGLQDLACRETRELQFACRCSASRIESVIQSLPTDEIDSLIAAQEPATLHCEMCGESYAIAQERLRDLREQR